MNLVYYGQIYGLRGRVLHVRVQPVLEMVGLEDRADAAIQTFEEAQRLCHRVAIMDHGPSSPWTRPLASYATSARA